MKRKVLVLGYFGYNTNQLDGQTVKTRHIYTLAEELVGKKKLYYFDTQKIQFNKLSVFEMVWKVIRCRELLYLPAQSNLKTIMPFLFCLSYVFHFSIHYFVVGGWLREFLANLPIHRCMLRHIVGIHVETCRLRNELESYYHFQNVDIFPNFRFFEFDSNAMTSSIISINEDVRRECRTLKICFVSRVEKSKGLDTLVQVAKILSEKGMSFQVKIDFYGPKKDNYFDDYLSSIEMYEYKGIIQSGDVISTLKKYDALIFPSHYEGEGCPGIMVEAFSAALPIIASDWKYNREFVYHGINGFICKTYDASAYADAIVKLMDDYSLRERMARQSYLMSERYSIGYAKKLMKVYLK